MLEKITAPKNPDFPFFIDSLSAERICAQSTQVSIKVQTNAHPSIPPHGAPILTVRELVPSAANDQSREVLTINEVAAILRCSRNHVSNVMNGKVPGLPALPHFVMGRRKLVRREWLSDWLQSYRTKC